MDPILFLRDSAAYLSNFYPVPCWYRGYEYESSEYAYQAAKATNEMDRWMITISASPGRAKQYAKHIKVRPDWNQVKDQVMYECVKSKFERNPVLAKCLLETGDAHIEEGNYHGDDYWGTVNGQGENKLGQILMRVRDELRSGR